MKKACIATILTLLLSFSITGMTIAADNKQLPKTKKFSKISGPHPVTMEKWTNIIRSLQKEHPASIPDKPFQFRLKQKNWVEL